MSDSWITRSEAVTECRNELSVAKTNGEHLAALRKLYDAAHAQGLREGEFEWRIQ
jgi:hypothetical protein